MEIAKETETPKEILITGPVRVKPKPILSWPMVEEFYLWK